MKQSTGSARGDLGVAPICGSVGNCGTRGNYLQVMLEDHTHTTNLKPQATILLLLSSSDLV